MAAKYGPNVLFSMSNRTKRIPFISVMNPRKPGCNVCLIWSECPIVRVK
jgi:hypothetical protein